MKRRQERQYRAIFVAILLLVIAAAIMSVWGLVEVAGFVMDLAAKTRC